MEVTVNPRLVVSLMSPWPACSMHAAARMKTTLIVRLMLEINGRAFILVLQQ